MAAFGGSKDPAVPANASQTGRTWRFFALLTERQIKRGVHRSVTAREAAITDFINHHNSRPLQWVVDFHEVANPVRQGPEFAARRFPGDDARLLLT